MSTPQQPADPSAPADAPDPIGSTQQFQAFASRTDEEDEAAGEALPGPDIPDVLPEDAELPEDTLVADQTDVDDGYDQFDAPVPTGSGSSSAPATPSTPSDGLFGEPEQQVMVPPARSDRKRALLLALAVVVLVAVAMVLLFVLI